MGTVRRRMLSGLTAYALPHRPHPRDGYTLVPSVVLRRCLNATVLVPCLSDSLSAVLTSIFGIVDVHGSPPLSFDFVAAPKPTERRITRVY
jgi:hypothetical protein